MAAVATQMLWASIILPMTPPVLLAVQMSTWACPWVRPEDANAPSAWRMFAVIFCRLPKRALLPASVPVRNTPSQPKIAATGVYQQHGSLFAPLDLSQAQILICTGNSTGGVMGKMIDAQSICVATAATHQIGREADIFKAVVWHSIFLASLMGLLVLLQAYVWPFQLMVPKLPVPGAG